MNEFKMYKVTYKQINILKFDDSGQLCKNQETSVEECIKIREDYLIEFLNILKASGYLLLKISIINNEVRFDINNE